MQRIIFLLIILIFGCKTDLTKNTTTIKSKKGQICADNLDSSLLRYAEEFHVSSIELNKNFSPALNSFLAHVDTVCLRQQKDYKKFILEILSKN